MGFLQDNSKGLIAAIVTLLAVVQLRAQESGSGYCYDGDVRLENSTSYYINGDYFYGGRVEVCYNGTYHPVCDENWTDSDARVVCNNIGYGSYSK